LPDYVANRGTIDFIEVLKLDTLSAGHSKGSAIAMK